MLHEQKRILSSLNIGRLADRVLGNLACVVTCRWLHPAVFVLLAAFDTLGHEGHAKPATLQAQTQETRTQQPNSKIQHMKQWLSSMWQFHRGS